MMKVLQVSAAALTTSEKKKSTLFPATKVVSLQFTQKGNVLEKERSDSEPLSGKEG